MRKERDHGGGSRRSAAPRRFAAVWLAGLSALAACSVSETLRPPVDVGIETASTQYAAPDMALGGPVPPAPVGSQTYPAGGAAVMTAAAPALSDPYAQSSAGPTPPASIATAAPADVAPVALPPVQSVAVPPAAEALSVSTPPAQVAAPPVQVASVAMPQLPSTLPQPEARPVVQASASVAGARSGRGLQTLVPSNPMLASPPRTAPPMSQPQAMTMPADEVACRRQLKRLGVRYTDLAPIREGSCGIDWPVKVSGMSGNIAMKPAATLSCDMALAFAEWTKNELAPAARWRYMSGVKTIHQGSSYSCRRIRGSRTLSEHGKGNALDVMRIELKNGRDIDVRRPGLFAFRQRGLLNNVRADACTYFTTVLGPGYDADHKDHFHFDIKQRRKGRRACR